MNDHYQTVVHRVDAKCVLVGVLDTLNDHYVIRCYEDGHERLICDTKAEIYDPDPLIAQDIIDTSVNFISIPFCTVIHGG